MNKIERLLAIRPYMYLIPWIDHDPLEDQIMNFTQEEFDEMLDRLKMQDALYPETKTEL